MASAYVDPNIQLPQATTGFASFYPAVLDALIAAHNLLASADSAWTTNAVAAPGAIDPTKRITTLAVDGTDAFTLADGTYPGQTVTCFVISGVNTPVGTITPANRIGYANVTALGALGDVVTFVWSGTGWFISAANGVTVA